MSLLKQSNGDDYPEAALRHLQDADVLLARDRFDGAAYLAGYVVECALKTLIQVETGRASRSHDLTSLRDEVGQLAAQAGVRTGRFYLAAAASLQASGILAWRPGMRYRDAELASNEAGTWLQDAHDAYHRIVGELFLAGEI